MEVLCDYKKTEEKGFSVSHCRIHSQTLVVRQHEIEGCRGFGTPL